ncbi:hypothetical protein [Novosphingobium fuchskuhlense]|uniref:hypothetical protein n=1 Tax=Novosphingobium fuchskuhlense TaxID=1117702 RepID=UPI000AC0C76C|nr:hypothetical protein [Novosphingobium fuchskuhlense]
MEDLTVTIMLASAGIWTVAGHVQRLSNPGGSLTPAARYAAIAYSIAAFLFVGYVVTGGSVKLDIAPICANALRVLGLAVLAIGFYLSFKPTDRSEASADLTPPAHPSRTPTAP